MNFKEHTDFIKDKITDENLINKLWRIENLYPIQNKAGALIPFKLNNHQRAIVNKLLKNPYDPIVVLKSRQLGITTLFCIWYLDDVLLNEGIRAAIQSHKQESLNDIFQIVRIAYDNMIPIFKSKEDQSLQRFTRTEIEIGRLNSKIEVKLEVRSTAINRMHFSEYAFTEDKRISASEGSLAPKCIKVYESTPNGLNKFYNLYQKEKERGNTFFFPWFNHAEYRDPVPKPLEDLDTKEQELKTLYGLDDSQIQFRRNKLTSMLALEFAQEYPENDSQCFLLSGHSLIDRRLLVDLKEKANKVKPAERIQDANLIVTIYKKPTMAELNNRPRSFFLGVDPAEGVGKDYSVAVLITVDDQGLADVVMTMRGYEDPPTFAKKITYYMNKFYKYETEDGEMLPQAIIERNNHGHAVLSVLTHNQECLYPSIYVGRDKRLGFLTTHVSKKRILHNIFNAIRQKTINLNNPLILDELLTLVLTDAGKIEAENNNHDDLVIALALAYEGYHRQLGGVVDLSDASVEFS